jgi:hypothetical protein
MDVRERGWIALAQDRDRWRAIGNAVMILQVARIVGKFWRRRERVGFSINVLRSVGFKAAARTAKVGLNLKLPERMSSI